MCKNKVWRFNYGLNGCDYGAVIGKNILYSILLANIAYKLKLYVMAHLWEPCLPGDEH